MDGIYIPYLVLNRPDLTSHDKIVYGYIYTEYKNEWCELTNKDLAYHTFKTVEAIKKSINKLRACGLVDAEYTQEEDDFVTRRLKVKEIFDGEEEN